MPEPDLNVLHFEFTNRDELYRQIVAAPNFLKTIVDINDSSGNKTNFNREQLYEFLRSSFKNGGSIFLLSLGKTPIGFSIGYNNTQIKKEFTLSYVAITKEHQRKGFGEFFLKKVYRKLEILGYIQISMFENNGTMSQINKKITRSKKYELEKKGSTFIKILKSKRPL